MTLFGSTWVCESSFSKMNNIKNKHRSTLTDQHLEDILRISCTQFEPDFKKIAQSNQCHMSH